jgi:LPS-assembly protein
LFPVRPTSLAAAIVCAFAAQANAQSSDDAVPRLKPERALGGGRAPGKPSTPTYTRAERIEGEVDERVVLEGQAEVRRSGAVLRADRIVYTVVSDEVEATGHTRVFQGGAAFSGPSLRMKLDAQTGAMPEANFTYAPRNGRGTSKLIEFLGEERVQMYETTYTSCAPGDDAWWVRANRLAIDGEDELATANWATLYFQGVPIFTSPYFQFPLGDRRRSGLLTPSFGYNTTRGFETSVPIYWNIAPNRDATFTPRLMAKRGVLLANEFRYLEERNRGQVAAEVIADDRVFGGSREHYSLQHEYAGTNGLAAGYNYNRVSDDAFFKDFGTTIVTSSQRILPQEAYTSFSRTYWNTALRVTKNQTLLDPLDPIVKPYERVPQATLSALRYDWRGFDVSLGVDATQFDHPTLETGSRLIANPSVSYPYLAPGYFVVPKVQWHWTGYRLDRDLHPDDPNPTRSLPIASLDSGLIFERDAKWFGNDVTQTLEPRLYYAYAPLRDQNSLPNFDSTLADFNFTQLFTENVFVGGDRIAEANQYTAALVGRVLDAETGAERLRAAIGQRYYFGQQRVVLPGGTARTDKESDVLFALSGLLDRHWITDLALQHSTLQNQVVRASVGVRWQPKPASVLSLAYRYKIDEIEQIDVAAQWPLSSRWYGVGRINWSVRDDRWVELLGGFEYKADCWVLRVAAHRYATATQEASTSIYFQLELNGLASVGTSPVEQLRRNIPGYQLINPPPQQPGRYDVYE